MADKNLGELAMNAQAFFIPDFPLIERRVSLSRRISAIPLVPKEAGRAKLGALLQLPPGAVLEVCGHGYNERTAKVRSENEYYFVFLQDLEPL